MCVASFALNISIFRQKRALEMQQLERERKEHKKERLKVQAKREALVKKVAYSRHIGAGRDDDDLFKSKCQLAVSHYSKNLMIKYGLSPWVQYVALLRYVVCMIPLQNFNSIIVLGW